MAKRRQIRLGIALSGGGARGWAHIGVLRALDALGLRPSVISGASAGALVGAAAATQRLDTLEEWIRSLTRTDVLRLLDARFRGGVIQGDRVMVAIQELLTDCPIETLETRYGAVATDLELGREVWLREGSLLEAVRASCALPGLFPPRLYEGRWLIDGGVVNPVPVSLCYAMGAEIVIAVHFIPKTSAPRLSAPDEPNAGAATPDTHQDDGERSVFEPLKEFFGAWRQGFGMATPGMFDVMTAAINIMQERIKRSRLAGEPPDLEIRPSLDLGMLDFHRADEAILAGHKAVELAAPALAELKNQL